VVLALGMHVHLARTGRGRRSRARLAIAWAVAVTACVLIGAGRLPRTYTNAARGERVLAVAEGSHGIVAVTQSAQSRRLKLDNSYVLGGTAAVGDERMQAHLPLLLHPAPRRVAFLGMGTGITAGAALLHPVERIVAVEIVPQVVTLSRSHFADANLGLIDAPRAAVVVADARVWLRATAERFDVIVGDLVVPWRHGEAGLFAAEHYAAVRAALAPGGLFCQWVPAFQLTERELSIVVATFLDAFPRATLWRGDVAPDRPALALIGHAEGAVIDPGQVARRVAELEADPANPQLEHRAGLWIFLVGPLDPTDPRWAGDVRHTDDRPWLELLDPPDMAASTSGAPVVRRRLLAWLGASAGRSLSGTALERVGERERYWRDLGTRVGLAAVLSAEGRDAEAATLAGEVFAQLPDAVRRGLLASGPAD
jgi:spermidine synthase